MRRRVKAVVTDLDGTFWWGPAQVHDSTLPSVQTLRQRGIPVLFATGRRYASAHAGLHPLGLAGPAVLLSGAIGADLLDGREWHRTAFDAEAGAAVLAAFEVHGLPPVVHVSDHDVDAVVPPGCRTHPSHLRALGHPLPGDPRPAVAAGRVVGFGVCGLGPEDVAAGLAVARAVAPFAQAYTGPDHVMGGWTIMVGPHGVSKISGIEGWCAELGVHPCEVLAVGDGDNDLEMLAWAGTSVAVTGGSAEAAGADHVIAAPQDGGWATVLDLVRPARLRPARRGGRPARSTG
ncbi:HAD family hydrolase [Euzebya sp.]|uniref:HAD family hydrolase n=1 Tax=Euzebya sp. TaxID=1971409 RepID=UPI003514668E